MKKVLFSGLLSLVISYVSAQTGIPAPKEPDAVITENPIPSFTYPAEPAVNNGVNNTINVYPPALPVSTRKHTCKASYSTWYGKEYYQLEYFRQISDIYQKNTDQYWKGKYEGFHEGLSFEKKNPFPPVTHAHDDFTEGLAWFFLIALAVAVVYLLSKQNSTPPPATPATPVIVYPPAPAPATPHYPVSPTASELMKLVKENGGSFKAGSDGSWSADIWEAKKEKPAGEAAAAEVKEQQ